MATDFNKKELISWLEVCLQTENITDISVDIVGTCKKGDNYLSDIAFVKALGTTKNGSKEEYNLVVKCSKKNKTLRENSNVSDLFTNEIHVYGKVIQAFRAFQKERGVQNVLGGTPKFYGCFVSDDQEVIVMEDLTKGGYSLWDMKKPMLKKHITLVLQEYAKFHATSVAMQDQEPKLYNELIQHFNDAYEKLLITMGQFAMNFEGVIEETYHLLKNELSSEILEKWKSFGGRVKNDYMDCVKNCRDLEVINHGDSWNNNFLFKTGENFNSPLEVSILDWQFARLAPLVSDLSHFLFSCISEKDLHDFDNILEKYYFYFSEFLKMLKSDPEIVYSKKKFLEDWKKYSKLGIAITPVVLKVCSAEREEAPDLAKAAEGGDYTKAFQFDMKDKTVFKNRVKPIIKFVVENDLV